MCNFDHKYSNSAGIKISDAIQIPRDAKMPYKASLNQVAFCTSPLDLESLHVIFVAKRGPIFHLVSRRPRARSFNTTHNPQFLHTTTTTTSIRRSPANHTTMAKHKKAAKARSQGGRNPVGFENVAKSGVEKEIEEGNGIEAEAEDSVDENDNGVSILTDGTTQMGGMGTG